MEAQRQDEPESQLWDLCCCKPRSCQEDVGVAQIDVGAAPRIGASVAYPRPVGPRCTTP